jgi:hypothetical protein
VERPVGNDRAFFGAPDPARYRSREGAAATGFDSGLEILFQLAQSARSAEGIWGGFVIPEHLALPFLLYRLRL